MNTTRLSYIILVVLAFGLPVSSWAIQIPLGLHTRYQVFVQEWWHQGQPFLCVANHSGRAQELDVLSWRSRTIPAVPLVRWSLAEDAVTCIDARGLMGERILEYRLDGLGRLGLLKAPMENPRRQASSAAVFADDGINQACPTPEIRVEHPQLWEGGGQPLKVTLWLEGVIEGSSLEFPVALDWRLPPVDIVSAESDSLSIERDGQAFRIRSEPATSYQASHRLVLTLRLPRVTRPSMYLLSGRYLSPPGISRCFALGLMLRPSDS